VRAPQSAAILEVFHAWFGLVRSPWFVTAVQVRTGRAWSGDAFRGFRACGWWRVAPPGLLRLAGSPRFDLSRSSQVGSRLGVLWAAVWAIPEVRLQQWVLVRLPLSVPLAGQETPVVLALGVSSMFIAWSLSEIIRYSFYFCKARVGQGQDGAVIHSHAHALACASYLRPHSPAPSLSQESGYVPYVITWLRYTGFMVLYPSGVPLTDSQPCRRGRQTH
jgi:hypothetical protein